MNRGKFPAFSMHQDRLELIAGAVGAAGAALTAEPATGSYALSTRDNFFTTTGSSRTSTGLFVMAFKEFPPVVLSVLAKLYNSSGTTLVAAVRSWSIANKTVTIDVRDLGSSGAVADPTTGDHIRVTVVGRESTV